MTEQEIHNICDQYKIENYTINPDGSIDVDGNVNLSYMGLTKIPIKFNKISGRFWCNNNKLTTLKGSPKEVGVYFECSNNKLTSLEHCSNIKRSLYCSNNKLKNLIGIGIVNTNIYMYNNPLESLEGFYGDYDKLYCDNKLKIIRKQKLKLIENL